MFWSVVALVVTVLVAFFVVSHFAEDGDDRTEHRPGRADSDEGR